MDRQNSQNINTDIFLRLLMSNQAKLYSYIFSLVPNFTDADDLMQNVTLVLLHQFGAYKQGTNFLAWARKIAFYEVLNFRKNERRKPLPFGDETLMAIADYAEKNDPGSEAMLDVLNNCLSKLNSKERQLITLRYEDGATTQSIADKLGVSIYSIYRAVEKIQNILLRCVHRSMAEQG